MFFFFFFFWLFRAFVRAVGAARNALALAENAYFYEGFRVLNRWMIDVNDMDEVGALMDLLTQFTRPYPLEKVRINNHDPEGGAIDAHVIEQMRERLVMGGFVHDHGYSGSLLSLFLLIFFCLFISSFSFLIYLQEHLQHSSGWCPRRGRLTTGFLYFALNLYLVQFE